MFYINLVHLERVNIVTIVWITQLYIEASINYSYLHLFAVFPSNNLSAFIINNAPK